MATHNITTYRFSNNILGIQDIFLKDIYMSYKLYATFMCCIILNTIQIHYKPSRTCICIQQSIVFGHLLLRIHYLVAPPGLDPVEGSQRFDPFLVRLLVFRFRAVTVLACGRRCALFEIYACANVCVCVYSPACIR